MPNHFGVKVLEGKRGLKLTREKYAIVSNKSSFSGRFLADVYDSDEGNTYSDECCAKQLEACLRNYDLSMEYFSLLNHDEFNTEIDKFLENNKRFVEVFDLNLYTNKPGYYIMILDEYCQVYVGTTDSIERRIRQHWSKIKPFDRLLCPMWASDTSILSIDSFRAFDTTRIFAYVTKGTFDKEDNYIQQFFADFVCNRMAGGRLTGGLLQSVTMMKIRKLK